MPDPANDPLDAAARERTVELVAEAMDALDSGGEPALATFCAQLGPHRDAVLARLRTLRAVGLMPAPERPLRDLPERIGDFQLFERLGGGGMGVVYRARQLSLGRDVALKLVRPDQLFFPGVRERFNREVNIVARLQHEGIVRLYSFGEDNGVPWFAMERIDGVSLADVLHQLHGRPARELTGQDLARCVGVETLPEGQGRELFEGQWCDVVAHLVERGAEALAAAHKEGVLHRDLKPSNIMLTATGRVVLLDFGLAWSNDTDRLTRTGAQLGTIHYMSPEQIRGDAEAIDERTDVYALGVVMRELLTLRPAFAGATVDVVAQRVQAGLALPFEGRSSSLTRDMRTVCACAMERDRERRYPSAMAFARDLRHLRERRPIAAAPPSLALRTLRFAQRHRTLAIAGAIAAVCLVLTPLVVAVRERSLRVDLQHSNDELALQVVRADINLALASSALNQTLVRIRDEGLVQVPDLRQFCDDVLIDADGLLDALLATNPADEGTRLRLAETLARAGFVRWQFVDLPRTGVLFRRALELLQGCTGEPDRIDDVDLQVRLAQIDVTRPKPEAVDAAYEDLERRAAARGPIESRPLSIRYHAAAVWGGHGESLLHRQDARALEYLQMAQHLRQDIARDDPSVAAFSAIGFGEIYLAECYGRLKDQESERLHLEASCAAVERATSLASKSIGEREQLCDWLSTLAFRLRARQQHEPALLVEQALDGQLTWLVAQRPTRLEGLGNWASNRDNLAGTLLVLERRAQAVTVTQATIARIEPTLVSWPQSIKLWRSLITAKHRLAAVLSSGKDSPATAAALGDVTATIAAYRASGVESGAVSSLCAGSLTFVARARLEAADVAAAWAIAELAMVHQATAVSLAPKDHIGVASDAGLRLLRAEVLLRLDRVEDAVRELLALEHRLPKDLLQQVPALAAHQDRADVRALLLQAAGSMDRAPKK